MTVVGKIKRADRPPGGLFLDITVAPELIFSKVEEVLVVSLQSPPRE
jgi:cell shape-determining protein MreC